jgi:hypothetical protein
MAQNQRLPAPTLTLAAKYVRMSTEHQQYSIDNQADAISRYAREHNMEIVRTYVDSGKSGLKQLWAIAKPECQRIVAEKEYQALDIEFVERCVQEFDAVDPRGERFRYHGDKFGIEKDPAKREDIIRASRYDLYIDFRTLPGVVQHVYDVLHYSGHLHD